MIRTQPHIDGEAAPRSASARVYKTVGFAPALADPAFCAAWTRLEASAALPTQGLAFVTALACSMLAGADINVFAVAHEIGGQELAARGWEGLAALLPLYRDASSRPHRWRMPGAREVYEPCDALYDSPEAAHRLAQAIAGQSQPVSLDRIPAQSLLVPTLRAAMKGRGLVSVRSALPCPTITLGPAWEHPEDQFNAGRRSDFRRAARKAAAMGAVTYEVHAPDPDTFDRWFDEALDVELHSWKKEAGTAMASDRAKADFFRAFFRAASAAGTFRVAFVRIDGQPAAMQLAIEHAARFWLFKIGYDERFGKCSPGTLLMLHTLRYAASRGLIAYELLGNIEPWISELWTRDHHECVRLRTYPFSIAGLTALAVDGSDWLRQRLFPETGA